MTTATVSLTQEQGTTSVQGWSLPLIAIFMRFGLIMLGNLIGYAIFTMQGRDDAWFQALMYGNVHVVILADVVSVIFLVWAMRREGKNIRELVGPFKGIKDVLLGLVMLVVFTISLFAGNLIGMIVAYGPGVFSTMASAGEMTIDPAALPPLWFYIWGVAVLPLSVGVVEELIYRGYAQPRLEFLTKNRWLAVVVMAVGFGVQHIAFSVTSVQDALARFVGTFVAGLIIGLCYMKMRRLIPLIIGHWLVDVLFLGLAPLMFYLNVTQ